MLPPEESSGAAAALRCATNEHLEVVRDGPTLRTVEVVIPTICKQGQRWLESSDALPDGVEICEGQVVARGSRALVSMLVTQDCFINPSTVVATARHTTKEDFDLLSCMQAAEAGQEHLQELLERCQAEAVADMKCEECTRAGRETFRESEYRKTGSKARKEALFPELEKEICQARKELGKPAG